MKTRSLILNISLIISTGCLAAGYLLAGFWLVVPALILLVASWVLASQRPIFWLSALSLVGSVVLAATGVAFDFSPILMVIASTATLVSWELIQFKHNTTKSTLAVHNSLLEKFHLRSLVSAASAGLVLALLATFINLRLPFGIVVLLVLVTIGGLVYSMQAIMKKKI
jgi:hypothetical protein